MIVFTLGKACTSLGCECLKYAGQWTDDQADTLAKLLPIHDACDCTAESVQSGEVITKPLSEITMEDFITYWWLDTVTLTDEFIYTRGDERTPEEKEKAVSEWRSFKVAREIRLNSAVPSTDDKIEAESYKTLQKYYDLKKARNDNKQPLFGEICGSCQSHNSGAFNSLTGLYECVNCGFPMVKPLGWVFGIPLTDPSDLFFLKSSIYFHKF